MSQAYKAAGVDIQAGNETVKRIKKHVQRTMRPEVLGNIGGFGGLFALKPYEEPVLVSATDGVGTKLLIAMMMDKHDTVGVDCVAMCVNDIIVQGAEPLFFLDYLATGRLLPEQAEQVIKGIADGCEQAGCALIGGETAEMPGMYSSGEYDIAGFAVGVAEKKDLLPRKDIQEGDVLIGLASSGLHSNGFSLVRKVLLQDRKHSLHEEIPALGQTLGEELLTPTRIYVKTIWTLLREFTIKGMAHITGGGFVENIPRVLPEGACALIDRSSWEIPPIFSLIQKEGAIGIEEMYQTFNMGIGMVLIVPEEEAKAVLQAAGQLGEKAWVIGNIGSGTQPVRWAGGDAKWV
ncbi:MULTISPECIES: phosphoribosylformylglycinamidine cyclo-ligase [Thermoactinomyces]|jgi:phosphoribosylformylglycinamidine cyclo-ligase|uniref:Phosphoribosylformylglycinamidine cyclo-ligase n=1 Tax=Thermoactinomyces vulgaris TaxID=2026 RepID=A0ABS0QKB6_THEVU|nr:MULTISPECIES: phosphoribosylformylglycinamidine cyclo-ligase [Thermoactinomyces]KFZ40159.1 phosphoribosylaminoimidazole synthetase [Thermoactinomyces sp. Gus2-1]KYQ85674.1 phosphoribosylaminoimidazole synthetase [Thermoactinomyces sp. AS95]MBA4552491.1 phosphoribosylformylglycinamidine cyclo-ligase [Thermoactinomyces vulgaris]MBA4597661.1 phosphoribosylformylglycinamidine cyclo-ligase [Thermoactinomyces vulgaris]MBH8586988.1 phosphoribosylformylglycinamidine cyclo-ligase [Thermoactinomyces 